MILPSRGGTQQSGVQLQFRVSAIPGKRFFSFMWDIPIQAAIQIFCEDKTNLWNLDSHHQ